MTTQQENYIESQLDRYRSRLENDTALQLVDEYLPLLQEAEEKERERQAEIKSRDSLLALNDRALETYIASYLDRQKEKIYKSLKAKYDKQIEKLVEEYCRELIQELG